VIFTWACYHITMPPSQRSHSCWYKHHWLLCYTRRYNMWLDLRHLEQNIFLPLWSRQWEEHNTVWIKSLSQLVVELLLIEDVRTCLYILYGPWKLHRPVSPFNIMRKVPPFCHILSLLSEGHAYNYSHEVILLPYLHSYHVNTVPPPTLFISPNSGSNKNSLKIHVDNGCNNITLHNQQLASPVVNASCLWLRVCSNRYQWSGFLHTEQAYYGSSHYRKWTMISTTRTVAIIEALGG
jgi:hypothetical protein